MVELLSPAGSYEGFLAALYAGADAIYAGGSAFGARAYAQNFSNDELLKAIDIAHLYEKKLYLTVNTLCKEREFNALDEFISPFYEAGLDGVIVQDIGIISHFRENYPLMEIHASTQMTLTSKYGAKYLKSLGATRIVPARELSLKEIQDIHNSTDIEIECFIHGAMCYCYSGQCLFSSFLGGRSGNRGRCAQPCRLSYSVLKDNEPINKENEQYVLSMKDLSTLEILPDLIDSGIASFKIEGRMKKPEYTGFVTSIYRKYIDLYYKKGRKGFIVQKADKEALDNVYKRSAPETGYYNKYNSRKLITLAKPNYESGLDDNLFTFKGLSPIKLNCYAYFHKNENCYITISNESDSVTVYGSLCQKAEKKPVSENDINKQLNKTGDTVFAFDNIFIDMQEDIFLPLKAINDLRRKGIEELTKSLLKKYKRPLNAVSSCSLTDTVSSKETSNYTVLCETQDQLEACITNNNIDRISRIYIESSLYINNSSYFEKLSLEILNKIYLGLPYICRQKDIKLMKEKLLTSDIIKNIGGLLIRNYEELYLIQTNPDIIKNKNIIADFNLYSFNKSASRQLLNSGIQKTCIPLELNIHEIKERGYFEASELLIYGYIPLMISAGCISKTMNICNPNNQDFEIKLRDRYDTDFRVLRDCLFDYNRILNSVPINLSGELKDISKFSPEGLRIQFSIESGTECTAILNDLLNGRELSIKEYTKGHFRKSVE